MCLKLSVIIPVYNDPAGISDTLDSLMNQSMSASKYEVIVVDNNSTDDTKSVIGNYVNKYKNIHMGVEEDIQSSYAARNTGIELSNADIIAFVDADMIVTHDWAESVVLEFDKHDSEYMGCNVQIKIASEEENFISKFNKHRSFPIKFYLDEVNYSPTCSLVVSRSLIHDIGPFNEKLVSGGDAEFGMRAAEANYNMHFAEKITMYHPARTDFRAMLLKSVRIGRGKGQRRLYDGKNPFSYRDFLPVNPRSYQTRIHGDVSWIQFMIYYIFEYVLKLLETIGILFEIKSFIQRGRK